MNRIITITLNKDNPCFSYVYENGCPCIVFSLDPQDIHFHFGPGDDILSTLQQQVSFLLNKNE